MCESEKSASKADALLAHEPYFTLTTQTKNSKTLTQPSPNIRVIAMGHTGVTGETCNLSIHVALLELLSNLFLLYVYEWERKKMKKE